jgi:putative tryptophan/tyrosine transport system substrate-binding protein
MCLRAFVLSAVLAALTIAAEAQEAGKVWRIGYLGTGSPQLFRGWLGAFDAGLRDLGYVEGKNVVVDRRLTGGRDALLDAMATELVLLKPDVLVIHGTTALQAAKKATGAVPIVMVANPDPLGTGLVASLARPGGQVTGLSDSHTALTPKRLEALKQAVPSLSRVAVLLQPTPSHRQQLKEVETAAQMLGITVLALEAREPEDLQRAFTAIATDRAGGLFVLGSPFFGIHRERIAALATKSRVPTVSTVRLFAEAGFLIAYGADFADIYRRAATYVDKILKGARPSDLPIEEPTKFDLVINLKTAKALGLTIPQSVLLRADEVTRRARDTRWAAGGRV